MKSRRTKILQDSDQSITKPNNYNHLEPTASSGYHSSGSVPTSVPGIPEYAAKWPSPPGCSAGLPMRTAQLSSRRQYRQFAFLGLAFLEPFSIRSAPFPKNSSWLSVRLASALQCSNHGDSENFELPSRLKSEMVQCLTFTSRPGMWNTVTSPRGGAWCCLNRLPGVELWWRLCVLRPRLGDGGGNSNIPPEQLLSFFIRVNLQADRMLRTSTW